jgi:hypothetical protein
MGRPKGSRNRKNGTAEPKASAPAPEAEGAGPEPGHNGGPPELTDDERRALLFQHKRNYEAALADKKAADANFKNACKRAKAECGKDAVDDIKDAIAFEAPNGQQLFAAEVERKQRIARWLGLPVGAQVEFNFIDRTPVDDRAFDAGKVAGMEGKDCKPPASVHAPEKWTEGWHAGQAVLMSAFTKVKAAAGEEDASKLSDEEFDDPAASRAPPMEGAEAAGSYQVS